jgi:tRNA U34 5-methylaminomethyl-2-thiouridine-forming methyltransferase MnmC
VRIEIIKTADQSNTLYVPELKETYHSRNGALQESQYVFIEQGLNWKAGSSSSICILEVGFGTGLNAFLTLLANQSFNLKIDYHALETHPVPDALIAVLNYTNLAPNADPQLFFRLHQAEWNAPVELNSGFTLHKHLCSLLDYQPDLKFDLVYFDAFAPDKQPELWTLAVFQQIHSWMNPGGILVTYSSKGEVKRNLRAAGFSVDRLPGPPMKRHMVRASVPITPDSTDHSTV